MVMQPPAALGADTGEDETVRISQGITAESADAYSGGAEVTPDGRFVAFSSYATNLVPGDTNEAQDVFVRDTTLGVTERVSISTTGEEGNGDSVGWPVAISANGRYVAFTSGADNLVDDDTNESTDAFVRDRLTGTTERISIRSNGRQANDQTWVGIAMSRSGRFVAFESAATNLVARDGNRRVDVFVRDRRHGTTSRISVASSGKEARADSRVADMSARGRLILFSSSASNLVARDANRAVDVFIHNRHTERTRLVSVTSRGRQGNDDSVWASMSDDGRQVAFVSWADNLVPRDTNRRRDIFVRDRAARTTERVSVSAAGTQGDRQSWEDSDGPEISPDGRYVLYESAATNLVRGDTNRHLDVFVHDRDTTATTRVSVNTAGVQGNRSSYSGDVTDQGQVAFESFATNLSSGDTNRTSDVFLRRATDG
ncbi:MAG TPA: hypothetical protein VFG72_10210 [Marmoricola sp.]|nr:hypothetical protein [Marmoricola sp.]